MAERRPFVIQQDGDRSVVVEADGTITKTFTGARAQEEANREADRLRRFCAALEAVPGATCPTLLYLDGPPWRVHMTRAPGVPLSVRLAGGALEDAERHAIADVLAVALTRYVCTFSEPYYDFHFRNVVSEAATNTLAFVDFGVPRELAGVLDELNRRNPIEVSLGNLVGSTVFEAMRPRSARVPRERRAQSFALARAVVAALVASHDVVTPAGVAVVARVGYRRSAHRGGVGRRAWYMARADATGQAARAIARVCGERPLA
jgi:hypothetical protein